LWTSHPSCCRKRGLKRKEPLCTYGLVIPDRRSPYPLLLYIHTSPCSTTRDRALFFYFYPYMGEGAVKKKDGAKWGSTPRLARYQTPSVTAFFLSCTNGSLAQQQPQSFRSGRRPRLLVYRARRRHHRKQIHRQETDPFVPSSRFGSVHGHVLACVTAHASGWWLATRVRSCGESRGKPVWSALFTYVHVRADSL
jgi:hypothetical protein